MATERPRGGPEPAATPAGQALWCPVDHQSACVRAAGCAIPGPRPAPPTPAAPAADGPSSGESGDPARSRPRGAGCRTPDRAGGARCRTPDRAGTAGRAARIRVGPDPDRPSVPAPATGGPPPVGACPCADQCVGTTDPPAPGGPAPLGDRQAHPATARRRRSPRPRASTRPGGASGFSGRPARPARAGARPGGAGSRTGGPGAGGGGFGIVRVADRAVDTAVVPAVAPAVAPGRPGGGPGGRGGPGVGRGRPNQRRPRRRRRNLEELEPTQLTAYTPSNAPVPDTEVIIERGSTARDLGPKLNRSAGDVIRFLLLQGEMVTATQSLTDDMIDLFAAELGRRCSPGRPR